MGCWSSKPEETGLIALIRSRRALIREAADHRYTLATAHAVYFRALAAVGDALLRYAREGLPPVTEPASHVVALPTSRKITEADGSGGSSATPLSHSLSDEGSHLHLSSDSEAETESGGGKGGDQPAGPSPNYYYMSSTAIPNMVYEDPYGGFPDGYVNDPNYYYGRSVSPPRQARVSSPPPPPPPDPQGSAWDFFDPFSSYDQFIPGYSPGQYGTASVGSSPSSSEVRAREGIPDLEDETELEPLTRVKKGKVMAEDFETKDSGIGSSKNVQAKEMKELEEKDSKLGSGKKASKVSSVEKGSNGSSATTLVGSSGEQGSTSKKKGVTFEEGSSLVNERSGTSDGGLLSVDGTRNVVESLGDVKEEFRSAIIGSEEVSKLLEAEERLRAIYEKKSRRLKSLDDRGAELQKINAIQVSVRSVRTKISIAITSVDVISRRMRSIMDEELQPQLVELIQGLTKMWKLLLCSNGKQLSAMVASKNYNLRIGSAFQDSVTKATMDLELVLLKWYNSFDELISTQKAFVNALNGYLLKWLPEDREETPDGVAPFSPSRIGAAPVFILTNDWSQAINRCSEAEVKAAIQSFAENMHQLWESQDEGLKQHQKADSLSKEYSAKVKDLQNEPTLDAMKKRLDQVKAKHDETLRQVQQVSSASLTTGLIPIFQSLSSFSTEILRAYEALRIPNNAGGS